MLTRTAKNGDKLSILGFGCMRFPTSGGSIEEERSIKMIRSSIEKGVNYFDTAYFYHNGKSETLLGKALSGGYRSKVYVATKLPPFLVSKLDGAKKIFATQLSRLQMDYIDYYLLHMLTDKETLDRMISIGVMEWLEDLKKKGTIKNIGFSFHGKKEDFVKILNGYKWDFCQIQYNYLDENNQATKAGLEMAGKMGIPVIIMEPLRGGKLVTGLPREVENLFDSQSPKRKPVEWALRWIWNHPEVTVVLSGMSTEQQLEDNIKYTEGALPNSMNDKELSVFADVKKIMLEKTKVPCTGCAYCMPCPAGVDIPGCFSVLNDKYLLNDKGMKWKYVQTLGLSKKPGIASKCIGCGKCESHCPQNIQIRDSLKAVSKEFEGPVSKILMTVGRIVMKTK